MSAVAVGLVLAAAVAHALWNRFVHGVDDRLAVLAVAGFAGAALLSPALVLAPPTEVLAFAVASGLAEAVYSGLLAAAYARGSLAVTYPIGRGTAPLLVTLGAWPVLGQQPAVLAMAGAVALAAGLVLVAGVARRVGEHAAVGWALGVGAAIATYSVVDAAAVRRLDATAVEAAGYLAVTLLLQGVFLAVVLLRQPRRLLAATRPGALVGVGVVVAYLFVLLAFRYADAGRVATLREASVLVAVALTPGARPRTVWVGAGFVVLGAVLVAV